MSIERRDFIKQACGLCASLVGIAAVLPALSSCSPLKTITGEIKEGTVAVAMTDFAENNNLVVVKNESWDYDMALVKYPEGNYKAFRLQCTHLPNPLVATKTGFFCNVHGSRYAIDGKVTQSPATTNLIEYQIQVSTDKITIKI